VLGEHRGAFQDWRGRPDAADSEQKPRRRSGEDESGDAVHESANEPHEKVPHRAAVLDGSFKATGKQRRRSSSAAAG
jgi:hypothetical protein